MVEKLTVIFFIILCLLLGFSLMLSPWTNIWSENYLLAFLSETSGLQIIQTAVVSPWARGAVTGLGVLNLVIAFWEIAHFKQSVALLKGQQPAKIDKNQAQ